MYYRTKILVHPFGYGYWLGENSLHDEEYFFKTWKIIQIGKTYKAQSKARGDIWELEVFNDDGTPGELLCATCYHDWERTYYKDFETIQIAHFDCPKCKLHHSMTFMPDYDYGT